MGGNYQLFDMPPGIEAALRRLHAAVKRDGVDSCIAHISSDKGVASVSLFSDDGTQHYITQINGNWYELIDVYKGEL